MPDNSITVQVATVVTLIGGFVTTFVTTKRSRDADDYKQTREENRELRADLIDLLGWGNTVQMTLAAQNITIPAMPHLRSQDFDETDDGKPKRRRKERT